MSHYYCDSWHADPREHLRDLPVACCRVAPGGQQRIARVWLFIRLLLFLYVLRARRHKHRAHDGHRQTHACSFTFFGQRYGDDVQAPGSCITAPAPYAILCSGQKSGSRASFRSDPVTCKIMEAFKVGVTCLLGGVFGNMYMWTHVHVATCTCGHMYMC